MNIGGFLAPLICGTLGELYGWHYGFGAAGVGMLAGLVIYLVGGKHLPPERRAAAPARSPTPAATGARDLVLLLLAAVAVTVFRVAYEQVGNTVALWMRDDANRTPSASRPGDLVLLADPLLVISGHARAAGALERQATAAASCLR